MSQRYDKLREHAVSYLSLHYSHTAVQSKLPETIERVVLGDMPHAGPVLRSLLGLRIVLAKLKFTESAAAATKLAKPHPPTLTKPVNVMWRGPTPTSAGSAGSGPPRIGSLFDSFVVNAIATSSSSSVGGFCWLFMEVNEAIVMPAHQAPSRTVRTDERE